MTSLSSPVPQQSAGPSLVKLLAGLPAHQQFTQPADALVILGNQLERIVRLQPQHAHLALGTLRFSLFRLHQGRLAPLAAQVCSLTVFGEPDVAPPAIDGITFVPLPPGSPLAQEWFVVVDSPTFWGALLTAAVPEKASGTLRRFRFAGALAPDGRIVSRATLLLALAQRAAAPTVGPRDPLAHAAHWGTIVAQLAAHPEAHRLDLPHTLGAFPELLALAHGHTTPSPALLAEAVEVVAAAEGSAGVLLYQRVGRQLQPVVWRGTAPAPAAPAGLVARAAASGQVQQGPLGADEIAALPLAAAALALPIVVAGDCWGVLLLGLLDHAVASQPAASSGAAVAGLLGQLLSDAAPEALAALAPPAAPAAAAVPPPAPAASVSPTLSAPAPVAPALPALPNTSSAFGLPSWMRGAAPAPAPAPAAPAPALPAPAVAGVPAQWSGERSWPTLQKRLVGALIAFDQRSAEAVWSEACSVYATEAVCTELLLPAQIAIGEGWHRGEVSVAAEHFASRFVEGKLIGLLSVPQLEVGSAPMAVLGCAQSEQHELGALMLALFMRWSGFKVIYLGQNVPNTTIEETVRQLRPQVLGLSATTVEAAYHLTEVGQIIARIEPPRPLFIFGGMAFYERPELRARIRGQFLEGDVRRIVRELADQLRQ